MFSLFMKKRRKGDAVSELRNSAFSEFMRNASAQEQKRVFKKVIEDSIKAQQAIIDRADRIEAEKERDKEKGVFSLSSND